MSITTEVARCDFMHEKKDWNVNLNPKNQLQYFRTNSVGVMYPVGFYLSP